jgi:hypothetical protein
VRYLVVGGYAVIHYTQPRFTKDLDLWLEPTRTNARRAAAAMIEFGIPLIEITENDLAAPSTQFVIGRSPVQIDFLTSVPPLDFAECWKGRKTSKEGRFSVHFGREHLKKAKAFAARQVDLADLEELNRDEGAPHNDD